jgi:putative tryptophan/tyrosine transport system substrate-binding protein
MPRRFILTFLGVALCIGSTGVTRARMMPAIGFLQLASIPALDAGRDGAVEALSAAGYIDGKTVQFQFGNANGDLDTLATIAQGFVDSGVDLIIATGTQALQAAYKATKAAGDPIVIFNAVTSPYAAGVADDACHHEKWIVGTQALAPYAEILPLIFEVKPDAQVVGYIYNPAEVNSVANTRIITPLAESLKLQLAIQTISNTAEVSAAGRALVAKGVDVFFVATDSTVVAGLDALARVANDNKVPLITSDPNGAQHGAVVAQGLDYRQDGRDSGRIAVAVLKGKLDIATAKILRQTTTLLAINLDAAEAQGVKISDDLLARATLLYQDGKNIRTAVATMTATDQARSDAAFWQALVCTPAEMAATPQVTPAK